jgi:hypothetical protein
MCRPLKSINIKGLNKEEVFNALKEALIDLEDIALGVDFNESAHILQFKANLVYLRAYYERLDRILRDEHN